MKHGRSTRLVWIGAASLVAAAMVVPAGLAGKPDKPGTSNTKGAKAFTAKLKNATNETMRGNVVVRLNASRTEVCWSFSRLKLAGKTAYVAHIHRMSDNVSIITLGQASTGKAWPRRGCTKTDTSGGSAGEEIAAVITNPAGFYVNVHEEAGSAVLLTGALKKGAPAA